MRIVNLEEAGNLSGQLRQEAYCALDATGTREIADVLLPRMTPDQYVQYRSDMAAQAPAFTMGRRGVLVNEVKRADAVNGLKRELAALERSINKMPGVADVWDGKEKNTGQGKWKCKASTRKDGKHTWPRGVEDSDPAKVCTSCGSPRMVPLAFNPHSSDQGMHLLYDLHKLPAQRNKMKRVSVDDDILLRLGEKYPAIQPITSAIQEARGLKKQLGFLGAKLSPTNRFHSSFNVGAAWTGRWSSSKDVFHRGGNLQNIAERHRNIFIADPGMELCYADLKQAESNMVAHLAGDEAYIEAHALGDVHTYATRIIWPDLGWTGDLKADKKIAKQNPPWDQAPGHEYRFQSKRIQHGGNYGLMPYGIAMIAKIPVEAAKEAWHGYHDGFPRIRQWQGKTRALVEAGDRLTNPLGRTIRLFGRPWDDHTYKQGLAFVPQSSVADIIKVAIWRIWWELERRGPVQLLGQIHDAILFQFPRGEYEWVRQALELMKVPVPTLGADGKWRTAEIDTEAAVGLNWGHAGPDNPNGIKEITFDADGNFKF